MACRQRQLVPECSGYGPENGTCSRSTDGDRAMFVQVKGAIYRPQQFFAVKHFEIVAPLLDSHLEFGVAHAQGVTFLADVDQALDIDLASHFLAGVLPEPRRQRAQMLLFLLKPLPRHHLLRRFSYFHYSLISDLHLPLP